uniref:Uncharacterized protein n=1 Tax=Anguilla anguilla TaxID=7936 RepID=A0A0E9PMP5_ANGAN
MTRRSGAGNSASACNPWGSALCKESASVPFKRAAGRGFLHLRSD